jgi:hypothetical protein
MALVKADIEQDVAVAVGAAVKAAASTLNVRAFTADDVAGAVEEPVSYPACVIVAGPAIDYHPGDVLFNMPVRVSVGTHHTQDRKATAIATHWKAVRNVLEDSDAIDARIAGNIRLMGFVWPEGGQGCTPFVAGDVAEMPNAQGMQVTLMAAVAACDENEVQTTTTTTTTTGL